LVSKRALLNCCPYLSDDGVHTFEHEEMRLRVIVVMRDVIEVLHHQIEVLHLRIVQVCD